ncbi:diguanylate cyclase domain-containing protein [Massilia sp. TS11]|uniref:sensor domain-containing diguanylate cyclase n=1 Tax=Massilia sp. TS11 TaxID=2908003 RepID=UPI001EDB1CB8|nr:diguanylate cyclase [Massilia sp. TS11]MCG2586356.1 diguanylate cyclase [Massilia sp. TS11]
MNPQSIKFRLMAVTITLMVVAVLVRILVAMPIAQEEVERSTEDQTMSQATYVAQDIDEAIRARLLMVSSLASALPQNLLTQGDALEAWLGERQRMAPLLDRGLTVLPIDGNGVLADYPPVAARGKLNYRDTEWFQRALGSRGAVLSRPARGRISAEPILIFAAAVRDADGRARAVLAGVARLDASSLLGRVQGHHVGRSGGLLVVAPDDRLFVGASDPAMVFTPLPPAGVNPLHDKAMNGFRGSGITTNAQGVEELSAIASVPTTGWFVVARVPTREAFAVMQSFKRVVLTFGLAFSALLIAIMVLALPRILRPLSTAASAMRDMADGKRELAPLPVQADDEVGQMLEGFNHLVKRLREKEAALEASEARMSYIAHHDSLTGLYNRAMLEDHLQQAIARAARGPAVFALLFIDLDGFKPVNDAHGHDVGDAVLVEVAQRLSAGRRRTDTVARQGGDEFVVLLADLEQGRADAEAIARHYLQVLAEPYLAGEVRVNLSASIGIAIYHGIALSGSQLMSRADTAMYAAKRAGKNQYCIYDEALDSNLARLA